MHPMAGTVGVLKGKLVWAIGLLPLKQSGLGRGPSKGCRGYYRNAGAATWICVFSGIDWATRCLGMCR